MRTIISPRALKELKKIPKFDQIAIAGKIRKLQDNDDLIEEKLVGFKNIFRVRVGDYRIVYRRIFQETYIVLIRHRKDVYRLVDQLFK